MRKRLISYMLSGYNYRFFLCAIIILASAGCRTVGPPSEVASENVNLPESFSADGQAHITSTWWESFEDPTLNQLVNDALQNNFRLQESLARVDEARAVAKISFSDRLPDVDIEGEGRRDDQESDITGDTTDRFSAGVVASYEVDLWGRFDALADADRFRADATLEDFHTAAVSVSAETALARMDGLAARGAVALLRQQVADNESLVELLTNRFRAGQAERVDVLRQEQLLLQTRRLLTEAEAGVTLVDHRLALLTGNSPRERETHTDSAFPALPPLPSTGIPIKTLTRRPDVRAAWLRVRAVDQEVSAALSARFPRLSLSVSYGSESEELSDLFEDWLWTLAGNLIAPVIDGGERRAEVDRTEAVKQQRLAAFGQSVLEAMKEVEDALVREQQQGARLEDLILQRDLAEETLDQLQVSYRNGAANFLNVLSARTTLQEIERETVFARRDRLRFRIALYRALAGGFDFEGELYD